jgi:hypothetical protein
MVTRRKETNLQREVSHPMLLQLHLLLHPKSFHQSLTQMLLQHQNLLLLKQNLKKRRNQLQHLLQPPQLIKVKLSLP